MSVVAVETRELSDVEQQWAIFIDGLEPWEIHKLHVLGELELHDKYLDGGIDLMTIQGMCMDSCRCMSCRHKQDSKNKDDK